MIWKNTVEPKDRNFYRVIARNLTFGIWSEKHESFFGLREKFGEVYVTLEDAATRIGYDNEVLPAEIVLAESLGSCCYNCKALVEYRRDAVQDPDLIAGMSRGTWFHRGDTACKDVRPVSLSNKPLFDWLKAAEARHLADSGPLGP